MGLGGSMSHSQGFSNSSYPEPNQSICSYWLPISLRPILILSSHLRLDLPVYLLPVDLLVKILFNQKRCFNIKLMMHKMEHQNNVSCKFIPWRCCSQTTAKRRDLLWLTDHLDDLFLVHGFQVWKILKAILITWVMKALASNKINTKKVITPYIR